MGWQAIPCPGFCPFWDCDTLKFFPDPGIYFFDPLQPSHHVHMSGVHVLRRYTPGSGVSQYLFDELRCVRMWFGSYSVPGLPTGEYYHVEVAVTCANENLAFPLLHFRVRWRTKLSSSPDVYSQGEVCRKNICMLMLSCVCPQDKYNEPHGPDHGIAVAERADVIAGHLCASDDGSTRIAFDAGSSRFTVYCWCHGVCTCYRGIPKELSALVQIWNGASWETVASGSLSHQLGDSGLFDGPNWFGEAGGAADCQFWIGMSCDSVSPPAIPSGDFITLALVGKPGNDCVLLSFVNGSGLHCDPFCAWFRWLGAPPARLVVFEPGKECPSLPSGY